MPEVEASSALDIRARMFLSDRRNASASGASMKGQTSWPQGPIVPVTIRRTVRLGSTNAIRICAPRQRIHFHASVNGCLTIRHPFPQRPNAAGEVAVFCHDGFNVLLTD